MPTFDFKGKQFVYAHHLTVPFRQLDIDAKKSLPGNSKPSLEDNLIIHGDNLHALKALLPQYAGKVKCIYIDPPYNTGNEGWCYNDKVNSPLMKEWLKDSGNPVDKDDLERHDKWLSMMWPRLQLLRELLSEDGVIFISIDDNEMANLKAICDEIFTEDHFLATFVWKRRASSALADKMFSVDHEYVLAYQRGVFKAFKGKEKHYSSYSNPDNDERGDWTAGDLTVGMTKDERPNQFYDLVNPKTGIKYPANPNRVWAYIPSTMQKLIKENRINFASDSSKKPMLKRFKSGLKSNTNPISTWIRAVSDNGEEGLTILKTGLNSEGTKNIQELFGTKIFNYPKPVSLVKELIKNGTEKNSIILDSFSGSGTTAQSVLELNKEDGGNRKFILVECEDYSDEITAERVRRVIKGVPGVKDEALKKGLGGSFAYCELGQEINIENLLKGEKLPSYKELARYAFYTATGLTLDKVQSGGDYFIGETENYRMHLVYKPDVAFLRLGESALNMPLAQSISKSLKDTGKTALVFATHKFMGQKELTEMGITFCQLPYAIHRVMGD